MYTVPALHSRMMKFMYLKRCLSFLTTSPDGLSVSVKLLRDGSQVRGFVIMRAANMDQKGVRTIMSYCLEAQDVIEGEIGTSGVETAHV